MIEHDDPTPAKGFKLSEKNKRGLAALKKFADEIGPMPSGMLCIGHDLPPCPKTWWGKLKSNLNELFDIFRSEK